MDLLGERPCVLLTIRGSDNAYGDDDDSYFYPERYRPALAPLEAGEPMLALVYEPGEKGLGRMAYVAWALLSTPPEPAGKTEKGQRQWRVRYDGGLAPLPRPVAQEEAGHVFEAFLRVVPRKQRGPVQRGTSVRPLLFSDFTAVLTASGLLPRVETEDALERVLRKRQAVERLVRERGFRLRVLSAYSWTCAVTGWSAPPNLSHALLDAAHWVAVKDGGGDGVRNGVALTPTVHRLLDGGVLGFAFEDGLWRLQRQQPLDGFNLDGPGGRLELVHGQPLVLPRDQRLWPDSVSCA